MSFLYCLLLTAAAAAAPADRDPDGQPVVEVFLPPILGANMDIVLMQARRVATGIYSGIGVRVIWRLATATSAACTTRPMHSRIVVALRTGTPAGISADALAFSNPGSTEGPCVTLLMERLEFSVRRNPQSTGFLLGHVLAHEIGHVLQGFARHSDAGVMKYRWSPEEVKYMPQTLLSFTPFDKELMLNVLRSGRPVRGE